MLSKFAEATPRNFSPKLTPELSDEARKAVNAAFDAMSTWRTETVDNFEIVIDKMAAAARALGWPQQIVDATHAQMPAFNPFGMYMQIAQQWQKTWSDAMGVWANGNKPISWRT